MDFDDELKSRIDDKLDQVKDKIKNLSSEDYLLLSTRLWEVPARADNPSACISPCL